jgi:hypothetical protein
MVPINVSDVLINDLTTEFGCLIGSMPFTYLGLPLGTSKQHIIDLVPLACRLERILACNSCFLSQGDCLQLINSALASIPLHFLCSLQVQIGFMNQIDRILRQCLWRDNVGGSPKQSLAAWEIICMPKANGGLGAVNFHKQNAALLIKHLDEFYNHMDIPWVHLLWTSYYVGKVTHSENLCGSFWWRDVLKLVDNFRGVAAVKHGKGDTYLFWTDDWLLNGSNRPLRSRFPCLFSYVRDENVPATSMFMHEDITTFFQLPLSVVAFSELDQLQHLLQNSPLTDHEDLWTYCWGERYTSAKFYKHIHAHIVVPKVYQWLWKSSCIMRTKTFVWLLLRDRLNTRDMLQQRHWNVTNDSHCELCPIRDYEDRVHLFFECNFSTRVWNYLQIVWTSNDSMDMQTLVVQAKRSCGHPFFMEVMIMACWHIWLIRNAAIFQGERPTFARWRTCFIHDMYLLQHRIKAKHKPSLLAWLGSLH